MEAVDAGMERALEERYAGNRAEMDAARNGMRELDALGDAQEKLQAENQRTMVIPAPPGFKPERTARKIRLALILEKTRIRTGAMPRFRVEMTNVGMEPIDYEEAASSLFVKGGTFRSTQKMRMFVTEGTSPPRKLLLPSTPRNPVDRDAARIKIPKGLSPAEMERWFEKTNALGQAHTTLRVRLLPGETLRSVGDADSPVDNFKTLETDDSFERPCVCRLQLRLDDRPEPLNERYIKILLRAGYSREKIKSDHDLRMKEALGPVSSNFVDLEVVR